jgi:hypothetical protein
LTGYYFSDRYAGHLPGAHMEWLVTHWHVQNEWTGAARLTDRDSSARTNGLREAPNPSLVGSFGYHGMPRSGFAPPGQRVQGTEIIPVLKGRSPVTVMYLPSGSPHATSHTWIISR